MKIVTCSLPNASEEINGVKFSRVGERQVVSAPMEDAIADQFASIPGYKVSSEEESAQDVKPSPKKSRDENPKA